NMARPQAYIDVSRFDTMVWEYADLGMRVWMLAANPLGTYMLPLTAGGMIPHPFADSLARRPDLMAVGGNRAVFSVNPPGTRPLPVSFALARFEGDAGRRLLAQVESPGDPAESLWVEWVAFDSLHAERARASRWMAASACDPTDTRSASFAADLPSGGY